MVARRAFREISFHQSLSLPVIIEMHAGFLCIENRAGPTTPRKSESPSPIHSP